MGIICITGASSGIGRATAFHMARLGWKIVACGRREERLEELVAAFPKQVHPLVFDVRDRAAVEAAFASLPPEFSAVEVLINNAGNAHGLDPIQEGNPDDWDAMMDINVKGLLYVTRALLPILQQQENAQILNIGSTAGKEVYPKGNVYCASKHAVDAINQGLRMDLNETGIRVGAINPGLVETEFSEVRFKGDSQRASGVYQGYQPLTPEDIAEVIAFAISRPAHVNIADLVVMPTAQASSTIIRKT
ncbi:NADP-dependent 3-hydroxy acid dehydrogenase YdfG [Robiginitalea myxolifaciens]|uniref:NADP-dependent 3-hydroxy acid dehydrogenase YdfG n=1 Tax=Robiginitalea myxolifaciens TaxID=400055 RepID=A0A1I6G5Z0_9FLAO|nr:SDR family NAD(P)-dependent oxidoreductase [Robiginitalea myxolifaciens]SFR37457.1 NADP-dependent 3-hydroxy acid dehydrogenase YdfG [Robiginitalea myxolifaciens]